mmetsp:Transcript_3855/g.5857  ORF Transcript_3855/g.5857 Transcript_3855/m.5857 type:complete len:111 (-) Transcript_3855:2493-2825(-)
MNCPKAQPCQTRKQREKGRQGKSGGTDADPTGAEQTRAEQKHTPDRSTKDQRGDTLYSPAAHFSNSNCKAYIDLVCMNTLAINRSQLTGARQSWVAKESRPSQYINDDSG